MSNALVALVRAVVVSSFDDDGTATYQYAVLVVAWLGLGLVAVVVVSESESGGRNHGILVRYPNNNTD